jgi:hypothetical protein
LSHLFKKKKILKSVYNSRHLNQKGKKKKVRKGTDYRERVGRKKELGGLDWTVEGGWRRQKQWAKA